MKLTEYQRGWADACRAISGLCDVSAREVQGQSVARDAGPRRRILDPQAVQDLMADMAGAREERFWTLTLDVRGRLMGRHQVAQGSVSACPVSPRDALAPAVREQAHGVVFVHNHPSGDPSPSSEDVDLTARLRVACEVLGILARDHVIVGSEGRFSFVEAGRWGR